MKQAVTIFLVEIITVFLSRALASGRIFPYPENKQTNIQNLHVGTMRINFKDITYADLNPLSPQKADGVWREFPFRTDCLNELNVANCAGIKIQRDLKIGIEGISHGVRRYHLQTYLNECMTRLVFLLKGVTLVNLKSREVTGYFFCGNFRHKEDLWLPQTRCFPLTESFPELTCFNLFFFFLLKVR